jgi:hypothetical protein
VFYPQGEMWVAIVLSQTERFQMKFFFGY